MDYCTNFGVLYLKMEVDKWEQAQRRAVKMDSGLKAKSYKGKLLELET